MKNLTISQAAEVLKVHPNTLRNWEKKNILVPTRNPHSNYRLYTQNQLLSFIQRGTKPKIRVHMGYNYSLKARTDELVKVKQTLDVIVSNEVSTYENSLDKELFKKCKICMEKGIKIRFIRDIRNQRMKEIAKQHKKLGINTRNRKVSGITISIRDKRIVRLEIPHDDPRQRMNILIEDEDTARFFTLSFEKLWGNR